MKKWREEIYSMMHSAGYRRKPALRRSRNDQFLLATDFPMTADQTAVAEFIRQAEKAGWRAESVHGWIYLDRDTVFEAAEEMAIPGAEAACCLSLLERHAESRTPSGGSDERRLLKAMEEGPGAYENVCGKLHTEWAESLRKRIGIPDVDKRFFGGE